MTALLEQDRTLPFIEMDWSHCQMLEFFNRLVLPAVCPGQVAAAVSVEDIRCTPGKECDILYLLQFGQHPTANSRWALVTFATGDKQQEVYTRHYGADVCTSALPEPARAVFVPEHCCLVEFFPTDWSLPFLARAMDPDEMSSVFEIDDAVPTASRGRPEVEVLRYRPRGRCVLRYRMESAHGNGAVEVIGKMYSKAPQVANAWYKLKTLYPQTGTGVLIISKPLRLMNQWNLVLMECLHGTPMMDVLEQGPAEAQAREATRLAAGALATFHRLKLESNEVRSFDVQLERLRKLAARFRSVAPWLVEQVDELLSQLAMFAPHAQRCWGGTPSLIHGDYSPNQVLVDGGRVAMVDFDSTCLGDPAIDVGNFMAHLHKRALCTGLPQFRELARDFLVEYQACSSENGVAERAKLFQSASLVRKALRSIESSSNDYARVGRNSLPDLLLEEAATCLNSQ